MTSATDFRQSRVQSALIVLPLALSIATMVGVRGAADGARQALQGSSRNFLAGDLCMDTRDPVNREQVDALDAMRAGGTQWTLMSTSLTMANSDQSADPGFVAIKAVDPAVYPFYGAIVLSPAQSLRSALQADTVAVSDDVLERFRIRVGDTLTIAGQPLRVAARIRVEPDRLSGELGLGMRCLVSTAAYQRTQIERRGNSVKHRVIVRLGPGASLAAARRRLAEIFPEGNLRDYRAAHQRQTAFSENAISFLSVTAFLGMALGAIGAGSAVRQFAEQRMSTFAIMKILGARGSQLAAVFCREIACLLGVAVLAGLPLGWLLRGLALELAGKYVDLPPVPWVGYRPLVESVAAACLAMAPVVMHPAWAVSHLRPLVVLRRGTGEKTAPPFAWTLLAAAVAGMGLTGLAWRIVRSWGAACALAAALLASAALAWMLVAAALRLLRWYTAWTGSTRWPALRYAVRSLHRPGNHSHALVAALATALIVAIATFEAGGSVVKTAFAVLPYDSDSLYVAGFQAANRESMRAFLQGLPGVQQVTLLTQARLELQNVKVPGAEPVTPAERLLRRSRPASAAGMAVRRDGSCPAGYALDALDSGDGCTPVTMASAEPDGAGIRGDLLAASAGQHALTADQWNDHFARVTGVPQESKLYPQAHPQQRMTVDYYLGQRAAAGLGGWSYLVACGASEGAMIADDVAKSLHVQRGWRLEFAARDRMIETTVAGVRRFGPAERFWSAMEMNCEGMDPASLFQYAALRVRPDRAAAVRQAIRMEHPTLPLITPGDISEVVTAFTADAVALIRMAAWLAVAAGLCVLVALIAASRRARALETGILSALGAPPSALRRIYTLEFAALGILAALVAAILATGMTSVVLSIAVHHAEFAMAWRPVLAMIGVTAVLAVLGGWIPTYDLLRRKPMEVLRGE